MKRNKAVQNLTLGLAVAAAASMMLSNVSPAFAQGFNMSAKTFVVNIQSNVQTGRIDAAIAMIKRLRQMGVTNISIDGELISLDVFEQLVKDGSTPAMRTLEQYANNAQTQRVRFEINRVEVASVETPQQIFPVSSFG